MNLRPFIVVVRLRADQLQRATQLSPHLRRSRAAPGTRERNLRSSLGKRGETHAVRSSVRSGDGAIHELPAVRLSSAALPERSNAPDRSRCAYIAIKTQPERKHPFEDRSNWPDAKGLGPGRQNSLRESDRRTFSARRVAAKFSPARIPAEPFGAASDRQVPPGSRSNGGLRPVLSFFDTVTRQN
jgi:hypothetical protein